MLRPYRDEDLPSLLDAWEQASRSAHAFLPEDFFKRERHDIAKRWMPIAETTVYEDDGRVVGFISMIENEVGAIFVDPARQGQGIGRELMDSVREPRPFLELDVFEANVTGRRFYASYGFEVIGEHVHESTGEPQLRLRL